MTVLGNGVRLAGPRVQGAFHGSSHAAMALTGLVEQKQPVLNGMRASSNMSPTCQLLVQGAAW
jgi:4-aminobutyrate aminotransferase-like enzyme